MKLGTVGLGSLVLGIPSPSVSVSLPYCMAMYLAISASRSASGTLPARLITSSCVKGSPLAASASVASAVLV